MVKNLYKVGHFCEKCAIFVDFTTKISMVHNTFYVSPAIRNVQIRMENGFALSAGGFEQPDYGGEDNL